MKKPVNVSGIIGDFILTFGSLETTLQKSIKLLACNFFRCDNIMGLYETIHMILKQNNDFSANLNILRFIVYNFVGENYRKDWNEWFKDVEYIMERRNVYAHNMYGVDDAGNLVKYKESKSYKKSSDYITIPLSKVDEDFDLLQQRYRQIFDSVIEAPFYDVINTLCKSEDPLVENKKLIWISRYPQLRYLSDKEEKSPT